ncbi:MAG: hypothetical protein ACJ8F4_00960 [Sphingomonas sp.]
MFVPVRDKDVPADCVGAGSCRRRRDMSAVIAFMILAKASSCAPERTVELPGGATIVRPVGTPDPAPFERLGPASGLPKPVELERTGAHAEAIDPRDEPPAQRCEVAPIQIV